MKILKILLDDLLILTITPELLYRVIKGDLDKNTDKLSTYTKWVISFIY